MTGWKGLPIITRAFALMAIMISAILLGACSQKKNGGFGLDGAGIAGNGDPNAVGYAGGPVRPGTKRDFTVNVGDTVHFETDSARLTPDAIQTLKKQAIWLRRYPNRTITIEGHSDERGTREYNLALGAKRAQSIKSFLIRQGVNPARIRTISYGKERPVATCNDISCWAQNRRGITVLNRG